MDFVSQHLLMLRSGEYFQLIPDSQNSFCARSEEIKGRVSSSTLVTGFIHKHNIRKSNIDPGM